MKTLKPKLYTVRFADAVLIVEAVTTAGAMKLAAGQFRKDASIAVSTPEEIYSAGAAGRPVITANTGA